MAARGGAGPTTGLLAQAIGGPGAVGVAHRLSPSGPADLSRRATERRAGSRAVTRAQSGEPARSSDAVYDAAGSCSGFVGALERPAGYRGGHAGGGTDASRGRGADRLLHQHAGLAQPGEGRAAISPGVAAGAGGVLTGVCASRGAL